MLISVRKYSIAVLIILISINTSGQSIFQYPTAVSQFFNNYPLINPAATGLENKTGITLGDQRHSGSFSRSRLQYAVLEKGIQRRDKASHHALGLTLMSNKEGNLLSLNRFCFQYAYHIPISEYYTVSSGVSVGGLSFHAEQTSTSASVSSLAPDFNFGVVLYSDKQKVGISSSQNLNASIRVINEEIPLRRFYRLFYSRSLLINSQLTFIPAVLYTYKTEVSDLDLNGSMLLKDLIFCGVSYRYNRGSAYFLGIKNLTFLGGDFGFTFAYNAPWPGPLGNIQTFEINLSFRHKR